MIYLTIQIKKGTLEHSIRFRWMLSYHELSCLQLGLRMFLKMFLLCPCGEALTEDSFKKILEDPGRQSREFGSSLTILEFFFGGACLQYGKRAGAQRQYIVELGYVRQSCHIGNWEAAAPTRLNAVEITGSHWCLDVQATRLHCWNPKIFLFPMLFGATGQVVFLHFSFWLLSWMAVVSGWIFRCRMQGFNLPSCSRRDWTVAIFGSTWSQTHPPKGGQEWQLSQFSGVQRHCRKKNMM